MAKKKFAQVNYDKKAPESNYKNNIVEFVNSITRTSYNLENTNTLEKVITGPDLIITKIERVYLAAEHPNDPKYYNTTIYNITIKNQGSKTSSPSQIKFALSDKYYRIFDVPSIAPGQSKMITVFSINEEYREKHQDMEIGFTNQSTGERLIKYVTLNYNKKAVEDDYTNNYITFQDNYYRYLPDLKITDIKRSGDIYSITIKNQGTDTAKASKLVIWYSQTKTMEITVPTIAVGKSITIKINFFPYSTHSNLYKYILLNYNRAILESNYNNNAIKFKI